MKYSDSAEKSAEYLRLAQPLMSKQDAPMHPVSYAVWYDYVAGRNAALTACLDEHLTAGKVLDEKATYDIYQKHVAEFNEEQARQIGASFQQVMTDVSASTAQAGDSRAMAYLTVSIGVAGFRPGEAEPNHLARADSALHAAKAEGRNRVAVAAD